MQAMKEKKEKPQPKLEIKLRGDYMKKGEEPKEKIEELMEEEQAREEEGIIREEE